jgi:hypothetical protein
LSFKSSFDGLETSSIILLYTLLLVTGSMAQDVVVCAIAGPAVRKVRLGLLKLERKPR